MTVPYSKHEIEPKNLGGKAVVQPVLLTAEACAARLGVSKSLIYKALTEGKLAGYRIGCRGRGCWRVNENDLTQWLESLKVNKCPAEPDGDLKFL